MMKMKWTALSSCLLLVTTLTTTTRADPEVTSRPGENRSGHVDPAVYFSGARAGEREGALLLLKDYMHQGDTLLKERVKDSYSSLKDMLKQGDSVLKEQLTEGVAQLKEQRKEGEARLKEELDEDVAWLKDRLAEGQTRVKEEMAEEEAEVKQELARQREALDTLKASVRESSATVSEALKQHMSDLRAELEAAKLELQTALKASQETLQSTQTSLQSMSTDLQQQVKTTQQELQQTRQQLQRELQMTAELKSLLQAADEEIESLKSHSHQYSQRLDLLESSDPDHQHQQQQQQQPSHSGSTFIRWGRTTCPDNTSLVYSGVAGGAWYNDAGGGSNYLCLVSDPQMDNMTLPNQHNSLHGSEYQSIPGHHQQDVVCSVCRAPQPTTIMIPATRTCPSGWSTQYRGHLVSERNTHAGRTEYVCLDDVREHRVGGHENKDGALMYLVVARCISLPCPPYVQDAVVTCVVCSM